MPYIPERNRTCLLPVSDAVPNTAGELHYQIAVLVDNYLEVRRPVGYQEYNEVIGVLACAQAEVFRRLVVPFENGKLQENGDVYTNNGE